ncbi:MAG: hypothetical protein K7J15_05135 [Candidatus Regiella insecticola]|nr:hypothetical protein [Candidatus Regiella insecticola]
MNERLLDWTLSSGIKVFMKVIIFKYKYIYIYIYICIISIYDMLSV